MAEATDDDWLPEDGVIRVTAIELGALRGVLHSYRGEHPLSVEAFLVNVRDREKPMPMVDRLIEKVEAAQAELSRTWALRSTPPTDVPK